MPRPSCVDDDSRIVAGTRTRPDAAGAVRGARSLHVDGHRRAAGRRLCSQPDDVAVNAVSGTRATRRRRESPEQDAVTCVRRCSPWSSTSVTGTSRADVSLVVYSTT